MAKVLKRIGTLAHKFAVDVTVHSLQMSLSLPVKVQVIWKRRNKRIETNSKPDLLPTSGSVEIEETLTMINTLYQKKAGTYMEKKADLTIQAIIEGKGSKTIGGLRINLSDFVGSPMIRQVFKLEKSPDRYSSVTLSVKCRELGAPAAISDNMSDASGESGGSYGTEGDYTGPPLFEQDLTGFEEETKEMKVVMGSGGRPPALIKGKQDSKPKRVEPHLQEMLAQISILEREKLSLQTEKEDLQAHYAALVESTRKDREKLLEHINSQDAQLEETTSLADSYKSQLESAENDNNRLNLSKKELQSTIKKLEASLNDYKNSQLTLQDENERLKRNNESQENKLKQLQRRLNDAVTEKTQVESSLIQAQSEIETLQMQVKLRGESVETEGIYRKQLETLRSEMEKREKSFNLSLSSSKSELERSEATHNLKLTELTSQISLLTSQLQRLTEKLASEQSIREQLEQKLAAESEDFAFKVNRMTVNMREVQTKKTQLEETLTKRFRAEEPAEISVLTSKIEEKDEQINRQKELISQLESDLTSIFEEK